jgi:hypothetical protein
MAISHALPYTTHAKISVRVFPQLFVLVILLFASSASAQTVSQQQTDGGTARSAARKQSLVRGRVIYEDTRRPLRRVQVTIYDPASRTHGRMLMGWTDGRGEFQIKDVPAGKYFVVVSAPGIVRNGAFDSEEAQRDLTSVTVDGVSKSEAVVVRVKRGGAISGKVTYADGDPAINTSIRILRRKDGKWVSVYVGGPSTDRILTDERGVYRVSGLSPGEYLVGAAEEKMGVELTARDDADSGTLLNRALLTTTYYAGATSVSGATALRIGDGTEETDIDITLADRPVHIISGVVTLKGDNHPIARARISLKKKDEDLTLVSDLEEPVINTDEQGRFTFDEVQDGSYTVTITPARLYPRSIDDIPTASQANANAIQKFAAKSLEVSVAGADLADLNIEVSSGIRISGTVTVEGGKPLPRNVLVYPEVAGVGRQLQLPSAIRVQPDGTFTIEGLPSGNVYLRAIVPQDSKFYTKSVTLGRIDLLRESLPVKEGEDITNVRIVISPDVAQLSGRVLASDGKSPQRGVGILLLPADPDYQKSMSRRIYGFTNADGGFSMSGAPGEYIAIVMRAGEAAYQLTNDALRLRTANAQRVTLQPGENSRLELVAPGDK